MQPKGFIGLLPLFAIIAVLIATAGGGAYVLTHKPSSIEIDTSPRAIFPYTFTDAQILTYTNTKYNFSIQYPADMKVWEDGTFSYGTLSVAYLGSAKTKDMFRDSSNKVDGYLDIRISTSSSLIAECGQNTVRDPRSDDVPSRSGISKTHSVLHNSMCYYINYQTYAYSRYDVLLGEKLVPRFDSILRSFRFN